MGKTVVLYATRYGTTERYAQEIASRLGCEAVNVKRWKAERFRDYDTVVFGGPLYGGAIRGVKAITQHEAELAGKRLVVFTVGMAKEDAPSLTGMRESNFGQTLRERIAFFHLRGAMDYGRLSPLHRAMMWGMNAAIRKMKEPTEEMRLIAQTYGKNAAWTDRAAAERVAEAARG